MKSVLSLVLAVATATPACARRDGAIPRSRTSADAPTVRPPQRELVADGAEPSGKGGAYPDLPPTTGPRELPPLDRSFLPSPEERWNDPEWQNRHRRVMDELWATKLGQMYLAYLTDAAPPITIPGRAQQIIELVYQDGDKVGTRLHVLQLLTEDTYARESMSADVARRVIIFDRIAHSRETAGTEETNRWVVNGMLTTFVASLPFGSPLLREEAEKLYKLSARTLTGRGRGDLTLNPERIGRTHHLIKGYRFGKAFDNFLRFVGPISMFYFLWYTQKSGWMKNHKTDEALLNGRDYLLKDASF